MVALPLRVPLEMLKMAERNVTLSSTYIGVDLHERLSSGSTMKRQQTTPVRHPDEKHLVRRRPEAPAYGSGNFRIAIEAATPLGKTP